MSAVKIYVVLFVKAFARTLAAFILRADFGGIGGAESLPSALSETSSDGCGNAPGTGGFHASLGTGTGRVGGAGAGLGFSPNPIGNLPTPSIEVFLDAFPSTDGACRLGRLSVDCGENGR